MDEEYKAKIKKALKFDWKKDKGCIFFLIFVIFSAYIYMHDTATCREVIQNPCEYCAAYKAFKPNFNETKGQEWIMPDFLNDKGGQDEKNT